MKKKPSEKPGWIKLYRKILDWEWYDDINVWRVFTHCLLMANFKDKKWHGITIKRGSFITSNQKLVLGTKLTSMQIRVAVTKLKTTNEITTKTTNRYTVISVNNYSKYQSNNQQDNKQITNKQQTDNKQITTTKEGKEGKKDKNKICISGKGKKKSQSVVESTYSSYKNLINPNSRLTRAARDKIRARLKTYSATDLIKAMTNFSQDSWWVEHNASRGVAWFFHSDDRIDQFINIQPKKKSLWK